MTTDLLFQKNDLFDLASVTKISASLPGFMLLSTQKVNFLLIRHWDIIFPISNIQIKAKYL